MQNLSNPNYPKATMMLPLDIRDDFPILQQNLHGKYPLIYFDNAASTQHPISVLDSMEDCYRRYYSNVHRGIHTLSETASYEYENARRILQHFIGAATPEEVIFTGGTTASINLVARSWCAAHLRPGDEILLTIAEHHSNIVPWQQAAASAGARVRFSPLSDSRAFDLDHWSAMLTDRTRLVSFTALSNVLGNRLPVRDMARIASERGVISVVDAAQMAPHEPLNVQEWGADFVAFSAHKMLGPSGIGILYGRQQLLEAMPPFLGGGSMIQNVSTEGFTPGELPAKFEAGTPPIAEAIGMGAAAKYLEKIGLQAIADHERELARLARDGMGQMEGIVFFSGSDEPDSGIVSFYFPDLSAQDVALLLDRKGVAVRAGHHCAMPLHDAYQVPASLRASFYLYNTAEEVKLFVDHLNTVITKLRR